MSLIIVKQGSCSKMKRLLLCSLLITGVILTLIRLKTTNLSATGKEIETDKKYAVINSEVSNNFQQQVNPNNLKIQMDLLEQAKRIEVEKLLQERADKIHVPQSEQVQQLHRQVPLHLESNQFNEHNSAHVLDMTENKIFDSRKGSQQKPDTNYLSIQPKTQGEPKVLGQEIKKQFPSTLNVYDISKPSAHESSDCIRTSTQTQFIICTYSKSEDIYVSGDIQKYGQWESTITYTIQRVLNQNKPITFLDIGANIGYFSLLAASTGQSVISVEPWKLHIQKLTNSIHKNQFQNRMTVLNNAVSNERRGVTIDISVHNNKGAARLVSDSEHLNINETITVKSILLNDLADLIKTPYVVLKLDIEGHECRVLEKSDEIFNRFKVLLITMEWRGMQSLKNRPGVACPEQNIQEMVDMLTRRGFVPYSFIDNQRLNPKHNDKWNYVDVYWIPLMEL